MLRSMLQPKQRTNFGNMGGGQSSTSNRSNGGCGKQKNLSGTSLNYRSDQQKPTGKMGPSFEGKLGGVDIYAVSDNLKGDKENNYSDNERNESLRNSRVPIQDDETADVTQVMSHLSMSDPLNGSSDDESHEHPEAELVFRGPVAEPRYLGARQGPYSQARKSHGQYINLPDQPYMNDHVTPSFVRQQPVEDCDETTRNLDVYINMNRINEDLPQPIPNNVSVQNMPQYSTTGRVPVAEPRPSLHYPHNQLPQDQFMPIYQQPRYTPDYSPGNISQCEGSSTQSPYSDPSSVGSMLSPSTHVVPSYSPPHAPISPGDSSSLYGVEPGAPLHSGGNTQHEMMCKRANSSMITTMTGVAQPTSSEYVRYTTSIAEPHELIGTQWPEQFYQNLPTTSESYQSHNIPVTTSTNNNYTSNQAETDISADSFLGTDGGHQEYYNAKLFDMLYQNQLQHQSQHQPQHQPHHQPHQQPHHQSQHQSQHQPVFTTSSQTHEQQLTYPPSIHVSEPATSCYQPSPGSEHSQGSLYMISAQPHPRSVEAQQAQTPVQVSQTQMQVSQTQMQVTQTQMQVTQTQMQVPQPRMHTPVTASNVFQLPTTGQPLVFQLPDGSIVPGQVLYTAIQPAVRTERAILPKPTNTNDPPTTGPAPSTNTKKNKRSKKPPTKKAPGGGTSGASNSQINVNSKLQEEREKVQKCQDDKITTTTDSGHSILHIAITKCNVDQQKALFEAMQTRSAVKSLVNQVNNINQTPLFLAVVRKQHEAIKSLLENGADPNILADMKDVRGGEDKISALHYAATFGHKHVEELDLLLQSNRIEVDVLSSSGMTPLQMAIWKHGKPSQVENLPINSTEIVKKLLHAGASSTIKDNTHGQSVIHFAVKQGDVYLLNIILEHYQDPATKRTALEQMTYSKQTPLHLAAKLKVNENAQFSIVHSLLLHGANKNQRGHEKQLPRDLVPENHTRVRQLLSDNYYGDQVSSGNLVFS